MKYTVNFVKHFNEEEKTKVLEYIADNIRDFEELKLGDNYGVDVSKAIGRTANIDIEVYALEIFKRTNNTEFEYYKVYDATNNELGGICATYEEAEQNAFDWLAGQGCTVEIIGYKDAQPYTVAKQEDF